MGMFGMVEMIMVVGRYDRKIRWLGVMSTTIVALAMLTAAPLPGRAPTAPTTMPSDKPQRAAATAGNNRTNNVNELLLVLNCPVDFVIVTGAQIDHDGFVAKEELFNYFLN